MKQVFIITKYVNDKKSGFESSEIHGLEFHESFGAAKTEFDSIVSRLKEQDPHDETLRQDEYTCTIGDTFMRYAIKKLFNGLPE